MKIVRYLVLLLLLAVGISFFAMNTTLVQLEYYFGSNEIPLAYVLIIAMAVGAAFGLLGALGTLLKHKRQISKLNKQVRSRENELAQLRALTANNDGV